VPIASNSNGSNQLLWRAADGTEGASVTATAPGNYLFALICAGYHGGNSGAPFDPPPVLGQVSAASTTLTVTGITTTLPGDVIVWFGMTAGGTPAAISPPSGYTAVAPQVGTSASGGTTVGALAAALTWAGQGATGNKNGSLSVSQPHGGQLVSIAAVPSPPGRNLIIPNPWPVTRAAHY
jgi:hypothetical protein